MSAFSLEITRAADKFIRKHPAVGEKIEGILAHVAESPYENIRLYDIKQCRGPLEGFMRLQVGGYRAIFRVFDDRLVVFLIKIDARGDVYKK